MQLEYEDAKNVTQEHQVHLKCNDHIDKQTIYNVADQTVKALKMLQTKLRTIGRINVVITTMIYRYTTIQSDYDVSRALASIRRDWTRAKMNMSIFRRSRIVVESQL